MIINPFLENIDDEIAEEDRYLSVVLAIYQDIDNAKEAGFFWWNEERDGYMRYHAMNQVDIVDGAIPGVWSQGEQNDSMVISFREWLSDPIFPQYLYDDWAPEKTIWAKKLATLWYQKIIDEYAIRLYGSLEKTREKANKLVNELVQKEYRERGFDLAGIKNLKYAGPITLDELQVLLEKKFSSINLYTFKLNPPT